jgi:hypothetical protein
LKVFAAKKNVGLVTYFHGHAVLFREMVSMSSFKEGKHGDIVEFLITDAGLEIPSHDLLIKKYMMDIRTDQFEEISIADSISYFPECRKLEFVSPSSC